MTFSKYCSKVRPATEWKTKNKNKSTFSRAKKSLLMFSNFFLFDSQLLYSKMYRIIMKSWLSTHHAGINEQEPKRTPFWQSSIHNFYSDLLQPHRLQIHCATWLRRICNELLHASIRTTNAAGIVIWKKKNEIIFISLCVYRSDIDHLPRRHHRALFVNRSTQILPFIWLRRRWHSSFPMFQQYHLISKYIIKAPQSNFTNWAERNLLRLRLVRNKNKSLTNGLTAMQNCIHFAMINSSITTFFSSIEIDPNVGEAIRNIRYYS